MPGYIGVCGGSGAAFLLTAPVYREDSQCTYDRICIRATTVMLNFKAGRLDCGDAAVYKYTKFSQPGNP